MSDVTITRDHRGICVTFEGRRCWPIAIDSDPDRLRTEAERLEREADDRLYRARRARALADLFEAEQAEAAERAARQRRERAAATRRRNADPFGVHADRLAAVEFVEVPGGVRVHRLSDGRLSRHTYVNRLSAEAAVLSDTVVGWLRPETAG